MLQTCRLISSDGNNETSRFKREQARELVHGIICGGWFYYKKYTVTTEYFHKIHNTVTPNKENLWIERSDNLK